jgi:hypothetical protein
LAAIVHLRTIMKTSTDRIRPECIAANSRIIHPRDLSLKRNPDLLKHIDQEWKLVE